MTVVAPDGLTYGTVIAEDGRCWLDRNLGATQVATSATDSSAYGGYYQWGMSTPGWSDSYTILLLLTANWPSGNNPCPTGFHVPTKDEWETLVYTENIIHSDTALSSTLKLPEAGYLDANNGSLDYQGSYGFYWSSDSPGANASSLYFSSGGMTMNGNNRANGFSVRCLQD
jgi:uncharacterized protein (TIGR02145 family)